MARNESDQKRLRPTGNPQQVLVAIFKALEQSEGEASLRRAVHATRALGYAVRNADASLWLSTFLHGQNGRAKNGRFQSRGTGRGTLGERVSSTTGNTLGEGRGPARAAKVSLIKAITDPSDRREPQKGGRRMKQAAFELGAVSAPEVDYDKPRLEPPENLPERFPEPNDELLALAEVFCGAFGGCKSPKAIAKHRAGYNTALAHMRQRGTAVLVAWQAFRDAVVSQEGKPLFGYQARQALAFLPSRSRPFAAPTARVDSCGCPLPLGVTMPRLARGETAHYDGEEFIYGSDCDPR